MPKTLEVKIPDIGDFAEVSVIEVMVKPGDTIKPEDPLITLESDKATMDVPSPAGGLVKDVKLKVGDTVAQGSLILLLGRRKPPHSAARRPAEARAQAEPLTRAAKAVPGRRLRPVTEAPSSRTGNARGRRIRHRFAAAARSGRGSERPRRWC
jgi:pyruvate/2-oxoglutarate dehydrogenase complex dihydrolipoamide acyltransferase (E2) component